MIISSPTVWAAIIPIVVCILLKFILDLKLAPWVVKWFFWVPVRTPFREKPHSIRGKWSQRWESGSPSFDDPTSRFDNVTIRQLGRYCYSEHIANGREYVMFGRITGMFFCGEWYDKRSDKAYFGAFQLRIGEARMDGKYLGHSMRTWEVNCGDWKWERR